MKSFATLAFAFAALSQGSLAAFKEGTYYISPAASSVSASVLTDVAADEPVDFEARNGSPFQVWSIDAAQDVDNAFKITSQVGGSLNCGTEQGSICTAGSDETQVYEIQKVPGGENEIVARNSGYFLRITEERQLVVAGFDGSEEEQFVFTSNYNDA